MARVLLVMVVAALVQFPPHVLSNSPAPYCKNLPAGQGFPWGQRVVDHWLAARRVLRRPKLESSPCYERLELMAYLMNHGQWISSLGGIYPAPYGGVMNFNAGVCVCELQHLTIHYVRVYKDGNNFFCGNLQKLCRKLNPEAASEQVSELRGAALDAKLAQRAQQKSPKPLWTFTAIRDPFEHFISGYSEIDFRSHDINVYNSSYYSFIAALEPEDRAKRFIEDFVDGHFRRVKDGTDGHVFTQTGFLLASQHQLNTIGSIHATRDLWAELERRVRALHPKAGELPKLDFQTGQHPESSATTPHRLAMAELLRPALPASSSSSSMTRWRAALCHVLLPDYVCFDLQIPADCAAYFARSSYPTEGINCPKAFKSAKLPGMKV